MRSGIYFELLHGVMMDRLTDDIWQFLSAKMFTGDIVIYSLENKKKQQAGLEVLSV